VLLRQQLLPCVGVVPSPGEHQPRGAWRPDGVLRLTSSGVRPPPARCAAGSLRQAKQEEQQQLGVWWRGGGAPDGLSCLRRGMTYRACATYGLDCSGRKPSSVLLLVDDGGVFGRHSPCRGRHFSELHSLTHGVLWVKTLLGLGRATVAPLVSCPPWRRCL
jgi:hypothetical protein